LRIHRTHSLGIEEAKKRVELVAAELVPKFNLDSCWQGDQMHVQGSGVRARISVTPDSIEVHVHTGLALMMLREVIRREIENSIDDHIA